VVAKDWAKKFPNDASPTTSTMLFLVRNGNPKNIKDWSDLTRPDVKVVVVNPKTGGNGRYAYLAAWGSVREGRHGRAGGRIRQAALQERARAGQGRPRRDQHLPAAQHRRRADHLRIRSGLGGPRIRPGQGRCGLPLVSIVAENPVAVVERTVAKKGTGQLAKAYLDYLYSDEAQEIAAKHAPPRSKRCSRSTPPCSSPSSSSPWPYFGSLTEAQKVHFNDGGQFDKLYTPGK
jgi:sulfate transport system substrate-binding protein